MEKILYRFLFWPVFFFFPFFSFGQEEYVGVSQMPALRNFLLEEFTAIRCGFCPAAHVTANNLHAVFGERIQIIALHVSDLADPTGLGLDLRTPYGDAWSARQGGSSMPSGAINRHRFDAFCEGTSYGISPSRWQQAIRSIMYDTAEVNLYAAARLDTLKRELTVQMEYFYPESVSDTFHTLTVALVEDFIRGPQSQGASFTQYLHQHVLRDLVTAVWGDTVSSLEKGKVMRKTFTKQIPEQYNGKAPVLSNLQVVAFMSDSKAEILNSTSCPVLFPERYVKPSVQLREAGMGERYARTAIPLRVMNLGTDTVRSVKLSIDWGGRTCESETKGLSIPYGHEDEVWFQLGEYPLDTEIRYSLVTSEVNGESFMSNPISGKILPPYRIKTDSVRIEVRTTVRGSDLSWTVRKRDGSILYRSRDYEEGEVQEEDLVLALEKDSIYSLEFQDMFLDGFSGGYCILDMDGEEIVKVAYMGSLGDKVSFVRTSDAENDFLRKTCPEFRIYPNPLQKGKALHLVFGTELLQDTEIRIFDMQGRLAFMETIPAGRRNHTLFLPGLRTGVYGLRTVSGCQIGFAKLVLR